MSHDFEHRLYRLMHQRYEINDDGFTDSVVQKIIRLQRLRFIIVSIALTTSTAVSLLLAPWQEINLLDFDSFRIISYPFATATFILLLGSLVFWLSFEPE